MGNRRVVITGMGVISPLGADLAQTWAALREGRSAIGPMQLIDTTPMRFKNAAEVRGYDPAKHFEPGKADMLDRFAQFAVVAAREALAHSGLAITPTSSLRTAVITGSCIGGQTSTDQSYVALYQKKSNRMHPLCIPPAMANAGASHIAIGFGIEGPAYTISTARSPANHAIGHPFWIIPHGMAAPPIPAAAPPPFCLGLLKAWEAMRVVSQHTGHPF